MFQNLSLILLLNVISLFNLFGLDKSLALNQLIYILIGILVFFLVRKAGLNFFKNNSTFFYWFFVGALIITFLIGVEVKGSKRWIDLYFFRLQPSEIFKSFFIIFFAGYFSLRKNTLDYFSVFFKSLLYFIIPTFIILKQPDLGSAMVYAFIFINILLFSKIPKKYLLYSSIIVLFILPITWGLLHDYQRNRLVSFVRPQSDQSGINYHMTQAVITTGSGRFLGRGLGHGTQSKLKFLPESYTDFAFASLVEQFGFVFGAIVIILYFLICYSMIKKIIRLYKKSDEVNYFNFLLSVGIFSYLVFQIFVNIGMNIGILPIAGISLPFISYGGSSLVSLMIAFSIFYSL